MPHADYRPTPADAKRLHALPSRVNSDPVIPSPGIIEADCQPPPADRVEVEKAAE